MNNQKKQSKLSTKSLEKAISQVSKRKKIKHKYNCSFCWVETAWTLLIPWMKKEIQICNNTSCIERLLTEARPYMQSDYL